VDRNAEQHSGGPSISLPQISNATFHKRLVERARVYYRNRQSIIEKNEFGWRQAYKSYQEIAAFFADRRIPLLIMIVTPLWDLECRAWRCQDTTITYREVVAPGRKFYDLLAYYLGHLTPFYLSLEKVFRPYTLEALYEGEKWHYGPKKNAIVASHLALLLRGMGITRDSFSEKSTPQSEVEIQNR